MRVAIPCGGKGTRLGDLFKGIPKALVPVNGRPALEYTLEWLRGYGVLNIVIAPQYLGRQIRSHFGDGSEFGVGIKYTSEPKPLGTAGSVKNGRAYLGDMFMVVNGDTLTNLNLLAMMDIHRRKGALATMALAYGKDNTERGVVELDDWKAVRKYQEKPSVKMAGLYNAGIYILGGEIFDHLPDGFCDFGHDVFPRIMEMGLPFYGFELGPADFAVDIGTLEGYKRAGEIYGK